MNVFIMFQLFKSKLVVTNEDEIKARIEAIKSSLAETLELQLEFQGDTDRDSEHAKQLQTLEEKRRQHEERVETILKTIQANHDEHKKGLEDIKTDYLTQLTIVKELKEVSVIVYFHRYEQLYKRHEHY